MQLAWADNVTRETGKPVLILTPLAVGHQLVSEGKKFGHEVVRVDGGGKRHKGIVTANYQKLHRFDDAGEYGGCVLDESSILKSFDGATRKAITGFMRRIPYRLLCTATAAPNDHAELGTSSEALGHLGHVDMIGRYFRTDDGKSVEGGRMYRSASKWRFKGHAEQAFWRWVCSWARAVRKPSDLGCPDDGFTLPALVEREHVVPSTAPEGWLFPTVAANIQEQRTERRRSLRDRCEMAAELVAAHESSVVWCHLNDEGDLLAELVPDAVQVSGSDSDEKKAANLMAFARGEVPRLITKPKIGAWGLNFQGCAHVVMFVSHSYEQYYQAVRRCWRFGQTRPVTVDVVLSEGEGFVMENMRRKARAADHMFTALVREMTNAEPRQHNGVGATMEVPAWLATR